MKIAIIPARGGSKRIPLKNIRSFRGTPMIGWSIQAAQKSECFDRIIVSTDNDEIANIALSLGAEVPFLRPLTYRTTTLQLKTLLFTQLIGYLNITVFLR